MGHKYPIETLTEAEARVRHSDCEFIQAYSIVDQDGDRRAAIFVWQRKEDSDKEGPTGHARTAFAPSIYPDLFSSSFTSKK